MKFRLKILLILEASKERRENEPSRKDITIKKSTNNQNNLNQHNSVHDGHEYKSAIAVINNGDGRITASSTKDKWEVNIPINIYKN